MSSLKQILSQHFQACYPESAPTKEIQVIVSKLQQGDYWLRLFGDAELAGNWHPANFDEVCEWLYGINIPPDEGWKVYEPEENH